MTDLINDLVAKVAPTPMSDDELNQQLPEFDDGYRIARHHAGQIVREFFADQQLVIVDEATLSALGAHDPTGADHLDEAMVASTQRDAAQEAVRRFLDAANGLTEFSCGGPTTMAFLDAFVALRAVLEDS